MRTGIISTYQHVKPYEETLPPVRFSQFLCGELGGPLSSTPLKQRRYNYNCCSRSVLVVNAVGGTKLFDKKCIDFREI